MDVILYQERTTRLHQDHIILHEVGHIIMSDRQRAKSAPMDRAMIEKYAGITGLEPEAVQRVAQRCALDDDEECAVELVATILMEWDSALDLAPPAVSEDPAVRRVQTALGDRRGWL
ncbi:hypothetical protein [Streptomyces sp. NPDC020965]|uniref:hypothetical protein n=1 Tax=Streptomyces sp. NPDC020965 TaxID=3365105 RepID=UPI0037A2184F